MARLGSGAEVLRSSQKSKHVKTFDAVMAMLSRGMNALPPNSVVDVTSDLERLLDRVRRLGMFDTFPESAISRLEEIAAFKDVREPSESTHFRNESSNSSEEEEFFSVILPHLKTKAQGDLLPLFERLQKDRALFQSYLYTRLGIYRSNLFISIYGDFTLCHEHPFLPSSEMVIGPRFYRGEREKLQRQMKLMPLSSRRRAELKVLQSLNEHADLSVARAVEWFRTPKYSLTVWEREQGDVVFFSEGAYYAFALQRAFCYGLPDNEAGDRSRSLKNDLKGCAAYLRLIRRENVTKRWSAVVNWMEAALYRCLLERWRDELGDDDRALQILKEFYSGVREQLIRFSTRHSKRSTSEPPSWNTILGRIRMVPTLRKWHFIVRHAASIDAGNNGPSFLLRSLELREKLRWKSQDSERSERRKAHDRTSPATSALEVLDSWLGQERFEPEDPKQFASQIRPVVDVDVFQAGDFNALIFPVEVPDRSRSLPEETDRPKNPYVPQDRLGDLGGVVFVSTQVDLLEDWDENRSRLNEMKTIFSILMGHNLRVALQSELLRNERMWHLSSLLDIHDQVWRYRHVNRVRDRIISESWLPARWNVLLDRVEPARLHDRLKGLLAPVFADKRLPWRLLADVRYYAMSKPINSDLADVDEVRVDKLIRDVWDQDESCVVKEWKESRAEMGLPTDLPSFSIEPFSHSVKADRLALRHVFFNLLLNAVEAVGGRPGYGGGGEITVHCRERSWGVYVGSKRHSELIVSIEDNGPDPGSDGVDIRQWFEPGFSTKKDANYGLGLASAWRTVARHRGRIWATRELAESGEITRVCVALPLREADEDLGPGRQYAWNGSQGVGQ